MTQFKADNGKYKTQSLFREFNQNDAPYCLAPDDKPEVNCKSLYQMYMASVDEFDCAMKALGSMAHWRKLTSCEWFMKHLRDWRLDMKARDESLAKQQLQMQAEDGNVTAQKTLFESSKKGTAKTAGRPQKKDDVKSDSSVVDIFKKMKADG
jgi:hypothetical protein